MSGDDWVLQSFPALHSPRVFNMREIRERRVGGREGEQARGFLGRLLSAGTQSSPGSLLPAPDSDFYCAYKDLHAVVLGTFLLLTDLSLSQALIWPLGTI